MENVRFRDVLKEVYDACCDTFRYDAEIDSVPILENATQIYISLRKGEQE